LVFFPPPYLALKFSQKSVNHKIKKVWP